MAKEKVLTAEQLAKRQAKEAKELAKWQKEMAKPFTQTYFIYLMVILIVMYIVDEITSNINLSVQSLVLFDLFNITSQDATSPEFTSAIGTLNTLNLLTYLTYFILPFYKALSDKIGRKPLLVINTLGMALGMFVVMTAKNIIGYFLGLFIIAFVIPNDQQTLYIMETAPQAHRAKLCNISKAIAILSIAMVGVMRKAFVVPGVLDSWRKVFIIPVILGLVVSVIGFFMAKETPVYMQGRINFLKMSDEERKASAEKAAQQGGGIGKAFKFLFAHKQTRNIVISGILFEFAAIITMYYETVMTTGGMNESMISTAIIAYPFTYAALTLIAGFVSDKWGRKRQVQIFSAIALISIIGFVLSTKASGNGIFTGLMYGCYVGGLWSTSDTIVFTMSEESTPTELRASVVGCVAFFLVFTVILGMVLFGILQAMLPLSTVAMVLPIPFIIISIIYFSIKVHETKDVDMATVTGKEWD